MAEQIFMNRIVSEGIDAGSAFNSRNFNSASNE